MKLPKISIITVCYNAETTIQETIRSVVDQQYGNKEFIVIDGKSKDQTVDIIGRHRDNIHFFLSEKDRGIPDALNKGIDNSTGEWLYFLSSDDVFFNDHVLADIFSKPRDADMIYGDVILKSSGTKYDGAFDIHKILKKNICHQAQFYRRSVFDRAGKYNERYRLLSDYEHTLRIYADPKLKTKYVGETIAIFNDTGRTSIAMDAAFLDDRKQIFMDRFKNLLPEKEIATAYETFLYYSFKKGSIRKGVGVLADLLSKTGNRKYINAAIKNFIYRFTGHA
jgi:glycosyltransferase involved in cell wall biosynthesis